MDLIKEIALFAFAALGVVFSLHHVVWRIRRDRRRVKVVFRFVVDPNHAMEDMICVEATNIGHRDVTIKSLTIELPRKDHLWSIKWNYPVQVPNTPLPKKLSDGQSAVMYYGRKSLRNKLRNLGESGEVRLTPACEDSTGRIYRGRSWKIDLMQ